MKRATKRRLRRNAYDEDALMLEDAVASGAGTPGEILDALRGSSAGLSRGQRETLALVAKTFPGGESFSRGDLAREIASQFRGARGQRVSVATGSIEASKALRALESGGFVLSLGGDPERFTLTEHGEHTALGARLASADDFAEKTLAAELARFEADEEAFRRRLPSGPRTRTVVEPHAAKRPPCRLCKINHSLKAHRSHRVDGARHKVTLTGQRLAEDMALTLNPGTLADGMETWARNLGLKVPARGSAAWKGLFTAWERHGMRTNPAPRSKLCRQGRHDFDPRTLACTRKGCTARRDEPGTAYLFGYSPDVEAEVLRREIASGQREMFRGDERSAGTSSLFKNPRRRSA